MSAAIRPVARFLLALQATLALIGCGRFDPTASQSPVARQGLWGQLEETLQYQRPFVPRLAGFDRWSPCQGARCYELPSPGTDEYVPFLEVGRMRSGLESHPTGVDGEAGALWKLLLKRSLDPAELEDLRAHLEVTDDSSQAAGLLLAAAVLQERPWLLFTVLDHYRAARDERSLTADELFNEALTLSLLRLDGVAMSSWGEYIGVETDPGWQEEAEERLAILRRAEGAAFSLRGLEESCRNLVDLGACVELTDLSPQAARELVIEELLPSWATTFVRKGAEPAATLLGAADLISKRLAGPGNRLLRDVIGNDLSVDRCRREPDRCQSLALGLTEFSTALVSYKTGDFEAARERFRAAASRMRELGSRFGLWATFYASTSTYLLQEFAAAESEVASLQAAAADAESKALQGRALWLRGLSRSVRGDLESCVRMHQEALALFEDLGEAENTAALHSMLAENLEDLGNQEQAWRHRYQALQAGPHLANPVRLHNIYYDAADVAERRGLHDVAGLYLDAMVEQARRHTNPGVGVEALTQRARNRTARGNPEQGLAELDRAQSLANSLPGSATRERLLAGIYLARFEALAETEPDRALAEFEAAQSRLGRVDYRHNMPLLYLKASKAATLAGEIRRSRRYLEASIDEYFLQRDYLSAARDVLGFFEQAREVFDRRIELGADPEEQADSVLMLVEWLHGVTVLAQGGDARRLDSSEFGELLEGLQSGLKEGEAVLCFYLLDQELLSWVIDSKAVRRLRTPFAQKQALRFFERRSRGRAYTAETGKHLSALYDEVARPLEPLLEGKNRLYVVPDGLLHYVPLSALRDSGEGRYFGETRTISVAPSIASLVSALERSVVSGPAPTDRAVFVADPWPTSSVLGLPPLPEAARAVTRFAEQLPGSNVILGKQATKTRLISALGSHELVHLGVHSLSTPGQPLSSRLVMAWSDADSGILHGSEIAAVGNRARVIVLAACGSGAGAKARLGTVPSLATQFLQAGAAAVVAPLWPVDDREASRFLAGFYRELSAGKAVADALRHAQIEASRDPSEEADWMPFVAFGGPAIFSAKGG